MKSVNELRNKYQVFSFDSYEFEIKESEISISFRFSIGKDIVFTPQTIIPKSSEVQIEKEEIEAYVFNLGLVEMLSYWKSTCSKNIEINAGFLADEQAEWWTKLLINGLGEFFYTNNIDFTQKNFVSIKSISDHKLKTPLDYQPEIDSIVLLGGGKDSVVSLEIVKELNEKTKTLVVGQIPSVKEINKIAQVESIEIYREIDPLLIQMNQKGFLNGHTPFSAYLAFLSILVARIHLSENIILSNEESANEASLTYLGLKINHQYSKTLNFEKDFRNYVGMYISKSVNYFSLLRPLHEIQIAKIFSDFPKYFNKFSSCNVKQKSGEWCCNCSKCLFVYTMLFPFVNKEQMDQIFHSQLFDNESLYEVMMEMVGKREVKPLECVGTIEESIVGMYLSIEKIRKSNQTLPPLLQIVLDEVISKEKNLDERADKLLESWGFDEFIPSKYKQLVKDKI